MRLPRASWKSALPPCGPSASVSRCPARTTSLRLAATVYWPSPWLTVYRRCWGCRCQHGCCSELQPWPALPARWPIWPRLTFRSPSLKAIWLPKASANSESPKPPGWKPAILTSLCIVWLKASCRRRNAGPPLGPNWRPVTKVCELILKRTNTGFYAAAFCQI